MLLLEVVSVCIVVWENVVYYKDLLFYVYVIGDDVGVIDSLLYGMFLLVSELCYKEIVG